MKKISFGIVSGFLFLLLTSPYSFAETCGPACGPGRGYQEECMPMRAPMRHDRMAMMKREHHLFRLLAGLGLDEKQKEAIKEIRSRGLKDIVRKRADLEVARIELRDILDKDQVDMAAAEATLKKMASLQTDIRLSHIKALQDIKAKLTPEQRRKWKEMREMGPMTGRMMHGGMGMTPPGGKSEGTQQE